MPYTSSRTSVLHDVDATLLVGPNDYAGGRAVGQALCTDRSDPISNEERLPRYGEGCLHL